MCVRKVIDIDIYLFSFPNKCKCHILIENDGIFIIMLEMEGG